MRSSGIIVQVSHKISSLTTGSELFSLNHHISLVRVCGTFLLHFSFDIEDSVSIPVLLLTWSGPRPLLVYHQHLIPWAVQRASTPNAADTEHLQQIQPETVRSRSQS